MPGAAATRGDERAEPASMQHLGGIAAPHARPVDLHLAGALVAGPEAALVLDDVPRELDAEEGHIGFVDPEASKVIVVSGGVEAAAAVELWCVVQVKWALRRGVGAIHGAELSEERGAQHDPTVIHAEPRQLARLDRRREHVAGHVHVITRLPAPVRGAVRGAARARAREPAPSREGGG